jgi:uncharacterized protein (DUF433 family)
MHRLLARIAAEPGKMGGKKVIRGRRVTPAMVLTMFANGAGRDAVLETYPVLEAADIAACVLYGARVSEGAARGPDESDGSREWLSVALADYVRPCKSRSCYL